MGSIPAEERARIKTIIEAGVANRTAVTQDMFDVVQKVVFKEIYYNTFQRFVDSPAYTRMHADIKNAYNKVSWRGQKADDFRWSPIVRSSVSLLLSAFSRSIPFPDSTPCALLC